MSIATFEGGGVGAGAGPTGSVTAPMGRITQCALRAQNPTLTPLTTGLRLEEVEGEERHGVGIDWLSFSCGTETAAELLEETIAFSTGGMNKSFGEVEERAGMGFSCKRQTEPRSESKEWGKDYETWEARGSHAPGLAEIAIGRKVRPRRIDVRFDLTCGEGATPDEIVQLVEGHIRERRLTIGIDGRDGVNTKYVGSQSSDRFIRVYRKDLQDMWWGNEFGPTMRIELQLNDQYAEALLRDADGDVEKVYAIAAAIIEEMTTWKLSDRMEGVPEMTKPAVIDVIKRAFQGTRQHGTVIVVLERIGLDPLKYCRMQFETLSRASRYRAASLERELKAYGSQIVDESLCKWIGAYLRKGGHE